MNYLWCTNQSASVWVVEKHFLALFMYELDQDLDTDFQLSWPLKVLSTIPLIHPVTHIYTLFMIKCLHTHTHTHDPVDASGGTQGSVSFHRNANVESGIGPLTFRLAGDPLYHSSYNRPSKEKKKTHSSLHGSVLTCISWKRNLNQLMLSDLII